MSLNRNFILRVILIFLSVYAVAAFQTTFWHQIISSIPGPLIWLNILIYINLYKKPHHAVIFTYMSTFILGSFSATPMGQFYFTMAILSLGTLAIRNRFFWPGSQYYIGACILGSVAFHLLYILVSYLLESKVTSIEFVDRTAQILTTSLFAYPTYIWMTWIDRLTDQDPISPTGAQS